MSALQAHDRLTELRAEREVAMEEGLHRVAAYMDDLEEEIAAVRRAYVTASVTEIAVLRGRLFGPNDG
jgi:hypothetical protein